MKHTTRLLLMMILVSFGLSACEKPAPGSQAIPATATTAAPVPGTTLLPPFAASPTIAFGATIDPNAPLLNTPTPTVDPAVPVVEPTPLPAVPEPTAQPTPVTSSTGETIHIVQAGENLYRIGLRYGFTYQELAAYNGLTNPDSLSVGQQIKIPPKP